MKKFIIPALAVSVLSLASALVITQNKNYQEVSAYTVSSLATTIDLNDCSDDEIRSYYAGLNSLGEGEKKILFLSLRVGKPFREYYQIRDCKYLLKKDYVPFPDRIRFHLQLTLRPLLHLWFLEDKAERKYYIVDYQYIRKGRRRIPVKANPPVVV